MKQLVCLLEFSLKRRFKCYHCSKMMVAETSRQEKSPNPSYYQPKIAQKLIEKFYDGYCPSAVHFNFNCHSQAQ